ncbi:MAG TPA: hypothetical protein VES69_07225 [Pyrinomonadaceae bacterium]|nr:hypothetical protein [Pyrinomonadaceae bacterium]
MAGAKMPGLFSTLLVTREELEQGIREDVIDGLLGSQTVEPVLVCIV